MALQQTFILFVALAILSTTGAKLLYGYILKETEPYAYALLRNIFSALLFLPLALANFSIPKEFKSWAVLITASIIWAIIAVTNLFAYKGTEVSIKDPLSQSKLLFTLFLGLILLKESATFGRIIGNVVIFVGVSLLLWHPEKRFGRLSDPGVRWTLLTALLMGVVNIFDKYALNLFKLEVYGFLVFLFPSIILAGFLPGRSQHIKHLLKHRWISVIISIVLVAATYYFTLKAYKLADVTLVVPLLQIGTLITVLGGIIILKEREHFWQRIIAATLVVAGSIIISL